MKKRFIFLLIPLLLLMSCNEEEPSLRLSEMETPLINGYYCRGENGDYKGVVCYPNVEIGSPSEGLQSGSYFLIYPNPAENYLRINVKSSLTESEKKLWITRAEFEKPIPNEALNLGMKNAAIGGMPIFQRRFDESSFIINLSSFSDGYYRVYLKVDEKLYYDNLVIFKNKKSEL